MPQDFQPVLYRDIVRRRRRAWRPQPARERFAPLSTPLSPRDTHTLKTDQPLDLVGAMGSTAALHHCSSAAPDGSVCSTLWSLHQFVNASRPAQDIRHPPDHIFYLFEAPLFCRTWPKAPSLLQPEASLTSPSSCTSATTAMPPCLALPCPVLSCPVLRLAPPGSPGAPGLN